MQRYSDVAGVLHAMVAEKGATETLNYLRRTVHDEPALADVCHGLSHEVGQAAFERYGMKQALVFEQDVCGSGYVHGVVESFLENVDDLEKALFTVCPPQDARCFHGIGHGLMDRNRNDLPDSLQNCGRFDQAFQRVQCAEGVFMENFDADLKAHPTKYLKPDDAFFPCRNQTKVNEGVCAFYAPRYFLRQHQRKYEEALDWCLTLPADPQSGCIKGVGAGAMKQNIEDVPFAESVCDHGTSPEFRKYCIEGLTSYYIVHHASSTKGREMCATLKEAYRDSCMKIAHESSQFYPD